MQHQRLQMSFHFWLCINTLLSSKLCHLTHYYLMAGILWLFNNIFFFKLLFQTFQYLFIIVSIFWDLLLCRYLFPAVLYVYLTLYSSRKYVSILCCKVILTAVDRKYINISNMEWIAVYKTSRLYGTAHHVTIEGMFKTFTFIDAIAVFVTTVCEKYSK